MEGAVLLTQFGSEAYGVEHKEERVADKGQRL